MNSITLTGRLTADPDVRDTDAGMAISQFRLAVQRRRSRDGEDRGAVYIDVVTFDGLAKVCGQYLTKGRRVAVTGRLELDEWEKDGQRRQRHKVVADTVEFLDSAPAQDPGPEPGRPDADDEVATQRERRQQAEPETAAA